MLIPLVNGYSFIQVIVLWVTLSGVGLADAVGSTAVDQFARTTLFAPPPPPQARQLAVAMLASNVCEQVVTALRRGEPRATRSAMSVAPANWAITRNGADAGR